MNNRIQRRNPDNENGNVGFAPATIAIILTVTLRHDALCKFIYTYIKHTALRIEPAVKRNAICSATHVHAIVTRYLGTGAPGRIRARTCRYVCLMIYVVIILVCGSRG